MNIISYHITKNFIANSDGEICTEKPWLDFLFIDKGERIKVLRHMDYSVACLLKMINIPEKACKKLLETTDLEYKGYNFQYMPGKWFAIKDTQTNQWAGFSDMAQYNQIDNMEHLENSPNYCSQIAKATGERVYSALTKLGLSPKSLTSPISAFNKEVLSKIDLPSIDDIPDEAAEYAYQCCKGSWIEAFQIGHFEDTLDFDIRSAYGSELAKLIDFRYGRWIQSKEYQPDAIYGYCKGIVMIQQSFSPILYKSNSQTYTPTGSWETYLTKNEVDYIYKWNAGTFEIEDGWWWIPEDSKFGHEYDKVLEPIIKLLYIQKQQSANNFEDNIIKRIISGIWGKFGEYTEKGFGELFNPVWCAEVETNIRLKVAEFVLSNKLQEDLLSVTVDGVLIKNIDQPYTFLLSKAAGDRPPLAAENNRAMGSWKLSTHCPAFIIGSGVQAVKDKHSTANFSLQYDWLAEQINKRPKASKYTITSSSPITLAKAITQNRFKDLGKLEILNRAIELDSELKRCYRTQPRNGKELREQQWTSAPWDISIIGEGNE